MSQTLIDVAWAPRVPLGHTGFSWGVEEEPGMDQAPPAVVAAPAPTVKHEVKHEHKADKQQRPKEEKEDGKKKKDKDNKGKGGGAATKAASPPAADRSPFSRVDIRVGKILKAHKHENADKLFIESIDVGEAEPRQIVSGLVGHYTAEQLTGHRVLVIANLKPAPLVKVTSFGMVLAAKNETVVQLVEPPESAKPGERVTVEGEDFSAEADDKIDVKKAGNPWGLIFPDMKTNEQGVACYKGKPLKTSAGVCKPRSALANAQLS